MPDQSNLSNHGETQVSKQEEKLRELQPYVNFDTRDNLLDYNDTLAAPRNNLALAMIDGDEAAIEGAKKKLVQTYETLKHEHGTKVNPSQAKAKADEDSEHIRSALLKQKLTTMGIKPKTNDISLG